MSDSLTGDGGDGVEHGVYRCLSCGNVVLSLDGSSVSCCGGGVDRATPDDVAMSEPELVPLLTQVFEVNETALDVCFCVIDEGQATVNEIADGVELDRSAVSRYVNHLVDVGILEKGSNNLEGGGSINVYSHTDPEELKDRLTVAFMHWSAVAAELLREVNDEKLDMIEDEQESADKLRQRVFWES